MKNFKKIVVVVIFGMMCLGGYLTYEYVEKIDAGYLMIENVEALTQREGTPSSSCARRSGPNGKWGERMFCDSRTNATMIYPCPASGSEDYYLEGNMDRCTR